MSDTPIYIVGSGAIGKALAVFLQEENKSVTLVRGSVDNIPTVQNEITVIGQDQTFRQTITTTTFSALSDIEGTVLLTTKAFGNEDVAQKLQEVGGNFSVVLLQNGLNIERHFEDFKEVYRCVLFATSQVTGDHQVTFKMVEPSPVGSLEGNNENVQTLVKQINTTHFQFRTEAHIEKYIWNKVIANCAFNTICPLLETDNGIFHRNDEARKLARIVIDECVHVASKVDIDLNAEEIEKNLLFISQKSDGQLISTYMDLLNDRPTEIASLNIEIANIAEELGSPEIVNNTRLLGQLIQLKSTLNE